MSRLGLRQSEYECVENCWSSVRSVSVRIISQALLSLLTASYQGYESDSL